MKKENMLKTGLKILLVGCPLNSGNGGVTALGYSAIANIMRSYPEAEIYIQHNTGQQDNIIVEIEGKEICLKPVFFHQSLRWRESQGLRLLELLAPVASKTPRFIRTKLFYRFRLFSVLDKVDAVLDISGGDSFTSIYGEKGFNAIKAIKTISIIFKRPLYLLPQSFGPFTSKKHQVMSRYIFENSRLIGCRDSHGQSLIKTLSPGVDSARIIDCPDIAFGMESRVPKEEAIRDKFSNKQLIGLNVSGLLYFKDSSFGLNFTYPEMIHQIVEWILNETDAVLILIPHVIGSSKQHLVSEKTDVVAMELLSDRYKSIMDERVYVTAAYQDPRSIKGIIGQCDFFLGARMHACIAAISQGVPALCHAYSDKFTGVMRMIGMQDAVIDMRTTTIDSMLTRLERELNNQGDRKSMLDKIAKHKKTIQSFFDRVVNDIAEVKSDDF